jgi:hypothetical protein
MASFYPPRPRACFGINRFAARAVSVSSAVLVAMCTSSTAVAGSFVPLGPQYYAYTSVIRAYPNSVTNYGGTQEQRPQATTQTGTGWSVSASSDSANGGTVNARAAMTYNSAPVFPSVTDEYAEASLVDTFMLEGAPLGTQVTVRVQADGYAEHYGYAFFGLHPVGPYDPSDGPGLAASVSLEDSAASFSVDNVVSLIVGQTYQMWLDTQASLEEGSVWEQHPVEVSSAFVDPKFTIQGPYAQSVHFDGLLESAVGGAPAGPAPEPSAWALMIAGFGAIGATERKRRRAPRHVRDNVLA